MRTVTLEDIMNTTIRNRANRAAENLIPPSALNQLFYGDSIPWSSRSIWFKTKWHTRLWSGRVRDAWLVLIGREQIGGDC